MAIAIAISKSRPVALKATATASRYEKRNRQPTNRTTKNIVTKKRVIGTAISRTMPGRWRMRSPFSANMTMRVKSRPRIDSR